MLAAQLCVAVHAAEHGACLHAESDAVCPDAVANGDDPGIAHTCAIYTMPQRDASAEPLSAQRGCASGCDLSPPSTGPPNLG